MPVCGAGLQQRFYNRSFTSATRRAPRRGTGPATRTTLTSRSITSSVMLVCGTRSVRWAWACRCGRCLPSCCRPSWCYHTCDKAYTQGQSITSSVTLVCGTRSVRSAPAWRCSGRPCRLVRAPCTRGYPGTAVKTARVPVRSCRQASDTAQVETRAKECSEARPSSVMLLDVGASRVVWCSGPP